MNSITRRQFLEDSILAAAAAAAIPAPLRAAEHRASSANDKITAAIIGCGIRGKQHADELAKLPDCEIAYVCDPDRDRAAEVAAHLAAKNRAQPKSVQDLRVILEDKSVAAVFIATPNHWHALTAIWAMQAGKDVYVEKPVSHNIWEGAKLVEAARKYKRIAAGGTQRRWWGRFRKAIELIHNGEIGDVYQANFFFPGVRDSIGFQQPKEPPPWLNWDLWVGPAPMQPYHENLVHYNWHWFWDFGNGELGNNGIHLIDVLRWGMRKKLPVRVHSTGGRFGYKDQGQTPNTQNVTWVYEDGSMIVGQLRGLYTAEPMSWDFFGTKAHLHMMADGRFRITAGRNKSPEPEVESPPNLSHFQNF